MTPSPLLLLADPDELQHYIVLKVYALLYACMELAVSQFGIYETTFTIV